MTFAIHTIGCKANQAESAELASVLMSRGHMQAAWAAEADAYVINTCTVTSVSDGKCRAAIRRIRRERPQACVAVMGCMSQLDAAAIEALGADIVLGTNMLRELVDALTALRGHPAEPPHPLRGHPSKNLPMMAKKLPMTPKRKSKLRKNQNLTPIPKISQIMKGMPLKIKDI